MYCGKVCKKVVFVSSSSYLFQVSLNLLVEVQLWSQIKVLGSSFPIAKEKVSLAPILVPLRGVRIYLFKREEFNGTVKQQKPFSLSTVFVLLWDVHIRKCKIWTEARTFRAASASLMAALGFFNWIYKPAVSQKYKRSQNHWLAKSLNYSLPSVGLS